MPIAAVLGASWVAYAAMAGAAVAIWYVGWYLRNSGDDLVNFVQDVRWGAHNWLEGALGWLRGWLWDVGNAVLDGLHNGVNWAADQAMRAGEVLRNWGGTLSGWSDDLQNAARGLEAGLIWLKDFAVSSFRAHTTDMPTLASGEPMASATYTNARVGQVDAYVDGQIGSAKAYTDTKVGDLGTTVEGVRLSARDYTDVRFGELGTTLDGELVSVRQYVDTKVGDLGTTVEGVAVSGKEYTDVRFGEAQAYASAQVAQLRADTFGWINTWQALLEWLRDHWLALAAFLANPWAWLFALAGTTLWYLVEGWLSKVWDGEAHLADP